MANTPNLGLHQWQPGDSFLRTDFNTDFSKIDTAIAAASAREQVVGTYTGTGDSERPTSVSVGFKPSAVLIYRLLPPNYMDAPVLVVRGKDMPYSGGLFFVKLTDTGFTAYVVIDPRTNISQNPYMNNAGPYVYIAFR